MQIIGSSQAIKNIREEVRRLARGRKDTITRGEAGGGKGLIAEHSHLESKDAKKPCARLNIGAIDPARLKNLVDLAMTEGEFYNPIAPDHGNFKLVDGTTLIIEDLDRSGLTAQKSICELLSFCRREKRDLRMILILRIPIAQGVKDGSVLPCILA